MSDDKKQDKAEPGHVPSQTGDDNMGLTPHPIPDAPEPKPNNEAAAAAVAAGVDPGIANSATAPGSNN